MEFIPYRMLRNEPSALRKKLADEGELIVTVEGKPFAVMIDLTNNENMEEILLLLTFLSRATMFSLGSAVACAGFITVYTGSLLSCAA